MSSVFTKQVGTRFKVLESEIASDGSPVSALMLRTMARNANRLLGLPQLLFNFVWDSGWYTDELTHGLTRSTAYAGFSSSRYWTRVLGPVRVPKKSIAKTMEVQIYGHIKRTCYLQWATTTTPFLVSRVLADSENVQVLADSGDDEWTLYTKTGIPIGGGDFETISAYIRGDADDTLVSTADYGSPNSGIADFVTRDEIGVISGAWNLADGSSDFYLSDSSVFVVFLDASGVLLAAPRRIVAVLNAGEIQFSPPLSDDELAIISGVRSYQLSQFASWRFANATAYTEAVT